MNKRIFLFLVIITFTLSGCSLHATGDTQTDTERNLLLKSPGDRLPSVPQELWNHVLLDARDSGISATLTDDVLITVIFVDDISSIWTAEDMEAVKTRHVTMSNTISEQATSYGTEINLQFEYKQVTLDIELTANDNKPWTESALSQAGLNSIAEASRSLENNRNVKEAPILLYRNTSGRAFAVSNPSGTNSEYAIIFNDDTDGAICRHELFHLFGAVDYYFPSDIEQLAKNYYPDSIMLSQTPEATTDPLTAYLIGWTDTLSDDALLFLQESSHLTTEYMNSEHEKEIYTGYVQDYQLENGTYTGNLVMGIQQGWGKMIWDDGSIYEGNWSNGSRNGEGTFTWPNGDIYEGQFENGDSHGQGTYTWTNGDIYTGSWYQGELHGEGTYTWSNEDVYSGHYENGQKSGQGTFTWASGDTYTGQYQNDLEHGYGVLKWSNGTVYEGDFVEGNMHGYGTTTYPDGDVVRGYWENGNFVNP